MSATDPHKELLARARSLGIAAAIALGLGLGTLLLPHGLLPSELIGHAPYRITAAITATLTFGFAVYFILALRSLMSQARLADRAIPGTYASVVSAFGLSLVAIGIAVGSVYWVSLGGRATALVALPIALVLAVGVFRLERRVAAWIVRRG